MYQKRFLGEDFKSSIVVFLVALPLCLGISLASGAPLLAGVVSGIIGGLIVGSLSNSRTSVSGPAAGLTIVVLTAITTLGDFYSFTLAVFIAGIFQIILGFLKAGQAGSYFPNSVIKGMLAAIGLILILKQIPHAVGFDSDFMGDTSFIQADGENTITTLLYSFKSLHLGAVIISILSLGSMVIWEQLAKKGIGFFKLFPGALFAVILGVILNQVLFVGSESLFLTSEHLVNLPIKAGFGSFFESLRLPNFSELTNPAIYQIAITLAIVASLETLLSIEAVDKLDPMKKLTNKNREMLAQGAGNMLAGLVGALPLTSVIVRSSANITSNNRSKLSAILHGLWMLLAVVFIPRYLEFIPLASLAAILLLVGFKLCTPKIFKDMAKKGKQQMIPFVTTILAILFTDLLIGIVIGMIVGFIFIIRSSSTQSILVTNDDNNYLIRFMKDASFLQKPKITKILSEIPNSSKVKIDGSNNVFVDNDIIVIIEDFLAVCKERDITCVIEKSPIAINAFFRKES